MAFFVYMLLCSDQSLYVGHTDDLDLRLAKHRNRTYCGYTSKRLPVTLIFCETFSTREEALAAERQIKRWTRAKKLALADGDSTLLRRLALRHTRQPATYIPRISRTDNLM
ncbi:MAG: GIY-YIG nuclease family protein [Dehalococcoidia bacterium]